MAGHVARAGKRKDGSTIWRARMPDPRRAGTAQIERRFVTRKDAERWLTEQGASVLRGTHVDPRDARRTFADLADLWRDSWVSLRPKTRTGYSNILDRHLLPAFAGRPIADLSRPVIQAYIGSLQQSLTPGGEQVKPKTVRNVHAALSACLAYGVEAGWLATNPASSIRLPRVPYQEALFCTAEEVEGLAGAMPTRQARVAVYVAAITGLRAGEQWALRRRDLDLTAGRLHVRRALSDGEFGEPKTERSRRTVALPGFLIDLLTEHLAETPSGGDPDALVFTAPQGGPVRHELFYKRVFRATIEGDPDNPDPAKRRPALWPKGHRLHGLRWHDLRHTAVALAIATGTDAKAISARFGHSSIAITFDRYGHLMPGTDDALAAGLDLAFRSDNVVPFRRQTG